MSLASRCCSWWATPARSTPSPSATTPACSSAPAATPPCGSGAQSCGAASRRTGENSRLAGGPAAQRLRAAAAQARMRPRARLASACRTSRTPHRIPCALPHSLSPPAPAAHAVATCSPCGTWPPAPTAPTCSAAAQTAPRASGPPSASRHCASLQVRTAWPAPAACSMPACLPACAACLCLPVPVPVPPVCGPHAPACSCPSCRGGECLSTGTRPASALPPLRRRPGHASDVDVVAWHPNSHYVATGSADRTVRLWDVASGATVRLLAAQTSCLTCLAFSPDGGTLAAGSEDGSIAVYDLSAGRR